MLACPSFIFPATMPMIIYPIWLIEEYASIRFILFWVVAIKFPKIILEIASIPNKIRHSFDESFKVIVKIRVAKFNPATLEVTDRKATTGVGESESN